MRRSVAIDLLHGLTLRMEGVKLLLPLLIIANCEAVSLTPERNDTNSLQRFSFIMPAMGTEFRIVTYAPNSAVAWSAVRAAYKRIIELEKIFSDYEDDSEVTQLSLSSGSGEWRQVSLELWEVLTFSLQMSKLTDGAFDVTVGPYANLWRRARRKRQLPEEQWMQKARAAVGYQHIKINPVNRSVKLDVPSMRLDFGAIAKGYAADQAMQVLYRYGITRAFVSASSDYHLGDPPPDRQSWRIKAPTPDLGSQKGSPAIVICLSRYSLSTSGDLYQYAEINGVRYSHIIDPRTGLALRNPVQVNVIAPTGMLADALATALCVLEPEQGLRLLKKFPGTEARIWLMKDQHVELHLSAGFCNFICETSNPGDEPSDLSLFQQAAAQSSATLTTNFNSKTGAKDQSTIGHQRSGGH